MSSPARWRRSRSSLQMSLEPRHEATGRRSAIRRSGCVSALYAVTDRKGVRCRRSLLRGGLRTQSSTQGLAHSRAAGCTSPHALAPMSGPPPTSCSARISYTTARAPGGSVHLSRVPNERVAVPGYRRGRVLWTDRCLRARGGLDVSTRERVEATSRPSGSRV